MMTFEEFQATRTKVNSKDDKYFAETYGLDIDTQTQYAEGYKYAGDCYIMITDRAVFYLIVEISEWEDADLATIERHLYDNWYVHESKGAN